jgi:ABC-type phosphate transport system substrate-binding protein
MKRLYLFALAGAIGCASGAGSAGTPRVPTDRNAINQLELESVGSTNLYELVEKLRPNFLRSRGQTSLNSSALEFPTVYVDGRPYGDIASLRTIITSQVALVRYYDAPAAAGKFGAINAPGVIDVTIKH